MNGYSWDALIRFYVGQKDGPLMAEIETAPEAGMFSAYTNFTTADVGTNE